ncbi:SDR family NAD(P)-dependent oxidoreductase [Rhodanobacter sp. MP1X3]|uniref:SDR family NAD(P)-dependent oxidoreductase n=1 Tax=Rhodanobacter sp. MP1X3 TaxID=2723086 RepID=UPI001622B1AA|nr:SDR family NAD(P)-dependent oxidoreductase [Rhodanobacter sp. MP1X3]MBB6240732.1 NAD(P)-dependent dehydrogenase (short-subunit alcohol dehydrogenase family) [Rhodanobacter sp. MP1X3]
MNTAPSPARRKSQRASSLFTAPPLVQQIALVSGANRGLGVEIVRQLAATGMTVLLGSRELALGESAARRLRTDGADVTAIKLDVTQQKDIDAAARYVENTYGRLDVLVNNAGSYYDMGELPSSIDIDTVHAALDTNLFGAWRLSEAMLPLMRPFGFGRIVNLSSGCASSTIDGECCPAYRVSKAALNSYTRALAAELTGSGILVNAVCPGWTNTEMGGAGGRPVSASAQGVVWAACLPGRSSTTGGFFRDGEIIPW